MVYKHVFFHLLPLVPCRPSITNAPRWGCRGLDIRHMPPLCPWHLSDWFRWTAVVMSWAPSCDIHSSPMIKPCHHMTSSCLTNDWIHIRLELGNSTEIRKTWVLNARGFRQNFTEIGCAWIRNHKRQWVGGYGGKLRLPSHKNQQKKYFLQTLDNLDKEISKQ